MKAAARRLTETPGPTHAALQQGLRLLLQAARGRETTPLCTRAAVLKLGAASAAHCRAHLAAIATQAKPRRCAVALPRVQLLALLLDMLLSQQTQQHPTPANLPVGGVQPTLPRHQQQWCGVSSLSVLHPSTLDSTPGRPQPASTASHAPVLPRAPRPE